MTHVTGTDAADEPRPEAKADGASSVAPTAEEFAPTAGRASRSLRLPATLDPEGLHNAFAFIARLHLILKKDEALTSALAELNRVLPADRWALYSARPLNIASDVRFEVTAAHPPLPGADEAGDTTTAGNRSNDTTPDVTGETTNEADVLRDCVRAAFSAGKLVRREEVIGDVVALPLVSDASVVGVLVGGRRSQSASAAWADEDGHLLRALAMPFAAWLNNRRQSAEAERLLLTDDLTGLRNARYLRETLISEIKRARRYNSQVAVLFLDLDNFKNVNDEHGHLVGSHTLIEAAAAILAGVRNTDTVARYGGDEFVVVLPDTTLELAEQVAERVRRSLADHIFTGGRRLELRLSASFGVAAFPMHAQSPQQLIAAADAAMYRAKAMRKNCVHIANTLPARLSSNS